LDLVSAALERAGDHDEAMALLDRIESLSSAIASTPATSLEGLRVKARATAWALLGDFEGDFDPSDESSINSRVAASIVRDLLRMTPSA
jgi:hypothetical protein